MLMKDDICVIESVCEIICTFCLGVESDLTIVLFGGVFRYPLLENLYFLHQLTMSSFQLLAFFL
jgi:hypothetical protein